MRTLMTMAAALTLAGGPLAIQQTGYSADWKRLHSEHFTAAGNASYEEMRAAVLELEGFRRVLQQSLLSTPPDPGVPVTLVVFKDDRSFSRFKPKDSRGRPRDSIMGYFLTTPGASYMAVAIHRDLRRTFQHLFHEYTHAVVRQAVRNAPDWLNEGLAEFYSTLEAQPQLGRSILGRPSPGRLPALGGGNLLTLRELLTYDEARSLGASPRRASAFYAQAWALVHYLHLGDGGKHRTRLRPYLEARARGQSVDDAVAEAFGMPLPELEERLEAYIRQGTFPHAVIDDEGAGKVRTSMEAMLETDVAALHGALLQALAGVGAPHEGPGR